MSNGLEPDQDQHSVCKGYQQTTKVSPSKEKVEDEFSPDQYQNDICTVKSSKFESSGLDRFISNYQWFELLVG